MLIVETDADHEDILVDSGREHSPGELRRRTDDLLVEDTSLA